MHHRVRVVDPGHRLSIGVQVGCGDVGVRADVVSECADEPASDPPFFLDRELAGVAGHPALGTAERNARQGTFPCHPGGERHHLVLVDRRDGIGCPPLPGPRPVLWITRYPGTCGRGRRP